MFLQITAETEKNQKNQITEKSISEPQKVEEIKS